MFHKLFGVREDKFAEILIISPFFSVKSFSRRLKKNTAFKGLFYEGISGYFKSKHITYVRAGMGATLVGDAVLSLAAKKYQAIYFLGAVGGLTGLKIGDITLIKQAREAGEFTMLLTGKDRLNSNPAYGADAMLLEGAERFLENKGEQYKTIEALSISSFFFETPQNLQRLVKKGYAGIDLELAAFYAAARYKQIPGLGLCFVSDLPQSVPFWNLDVGKKLMVHTAMEKSINLILDIATSYVSVANNRAGQREDKTNPMAILPKVFQNMDLNQNKAAELEELIQEISCRDAVPPEAVVEACGIEKIISRNNLPPEQKFALIQRTLFKKRFPIYSQEKEKLENFIQELRLPKEIKAEAADFFEKRNLTLTLDIDSAQSLGRHLGILRQLQEQGKLKELFHAFSK